MIAPRIGIRAALRRMSAAVSILAIVAILSPSSFAESTLPLAAKTALQEGIAAAKFQNWDSAQKYFDEALAAAPGAPEVLFNLGLLNDRKGGAELVASAWYRAYLAALPTASNRTQVEARLIELHASAEARAAKYLATAKEAAKNLAPTVSPSGELSFDENNSRGKMFDPGCKGGFRTLSLAETMSGYPETVDEIIGWFQGNECRNDFLYHVVEDLLALKQPQAASRFIDKLSGPWKITALTLFAAVRWREGDKTGAIKLVEEAESAATQLFKEFGEVVFTDNYDSRRHRIRYDTLRASSEMAIAWCLVGNEAKALRSIRRFYQIISPYEGDGQYAAQFNPRLLDFTLRIVLATQVLSGKEKDAKAAISSIISKSPEVNRQYVEYTLMSIWDQTLTTSRENLVRDRDYNLPLFYRFRNIDEHGWLASRSSVQLARESNKAEQDYWIEMAKGNFLFGDVYRDEGKFLAAASDPAYTVGSLSQGSADLLLGSQKIKEIAEAWRMAGADPAQ